MPKGVLQLGVTDIEEAITRAVSEIAKRYAIDEKVDRRWFRMGRTDERRS